jgi:hypothetical protein
MRFPDADEERVAPSQYRRRLGASGRGVILFVEGHSLTDERVRLYSGAMRDWGNPNDRYGCTIFGSTQARF